MYILNIALNADIAKIGKLEKQLNANFVNYTNGHAMNHIREVAHHIIKHAFITYPNSSIKVYISGVHYTLLLESQAVATVLGSKERTTKCRGNIHPKVYPKTPCKREWIL
jgi:hypothetical protein